MYIIKDYLTDETVAVVTRKEDAVAMVRSQLPNERRLIFVEKNSKNHTQSS